MRARESVCGEDFCESCGDCLHCFGSDPCLGDGDGVRRNHIWPERCEFCHDPVSEHTESELRSCQLDVERRDMESRMG